MCGISGIIKQNNSITISEIDTLSSIQRHRGPDNTGIWKEDGIALIHNRLSL